jgi:hypothetical protein
VRVRWPARLALRVLARDQYARVAQVEEHAVLVGDEFIARERAHLARIVHACRPLARASALDHLDHELAQLARVERGISAVQEVAQRLAHVDRALVAGARLTLQRSQHDLGQLARDVAAQALRARYLGAAHVRDQLGHRLAVVEHVPRQDLEQQDAAREHVAAAIRGVAPGLLRRHVEVLALDDAGLGALAVIALGDAKVDQLHLACLADHHVLR